MPRNTKADGRSRRDLTCLCLESGRPPSRGTTVGVSASTRGGGLRPKANAGAACVVMVQRPMMRRTAFVPKALGQGLHLCRQSATAIMLGQVTVGDGEAVFVVAVLVAMLPCRHRGTASRIVRGTGHMEAGGRCDLTRWVYFYLEPTVGRLHRLSIVAHPKGC